MEHAVHIGPYESIRRLGRGGMGVVHLGRHRVTGRLAAVKTVRATSETMLSGVRVEVKALASVQHPGVVRVFDDGIDNGVPWYAMEFIEGATLRDRMEDARIRDDLAERESLLAVIRRLCVTLAYLHGEGVVHRDLKPANIIVQPNGNPVLVDFGIVGRFAGTSNREALGDTSQAIGTIAYASPEQLQGDFVDARTDLYALGCVLFEILTGRLPFDPDVLFLCQPNGLHGEPGFTDAALAEDDLDAPATIGQRRERIDEPGARRLAAGNSGSVEIGP